MKAFKPMEGVTPKALLRLSQYEWPGNVRELENVLERAFHFSTGNWIDVENLTLETAQPDIPKGKPVVEPISPSSDKGFNPKELMDNTEKSLLIQALTKADGNRTKAAEILGISRSTLYQKIKNSK